jgi:hypothetical protein
MKNKKNFFLVLLISNIFLLFNFLISCKKENKYISVYNDPPSIKETKVYYSLDEKFEYNDKYLIIKNTKNDYSNLDLTKFSLSLNIDTNLTNDDFKNSSNSIYIQYFSEIINLEFVSYNNTTITYNVKKSNVDFTNFPNYNITTNITSMMVIFEFDCFKEENLEANTVKYNDFRVYLTKEEA